jgi:hypothetical protein
MKNQIVKHYLIKWGYFDQNLPYLDNLEKIKMKILYLALKELKPEERQFLAGKYRVAKKPIIADAVLAVQYGLDLRTYREKRIALETKINPAIKKHATLYHDELMEAIKSD